MKTIAIPAADSTVLALKELSQGKTRVSFTLPTKIFDEALKAADILYSAGDRTLEVVFEVHRLDDIITVRGDLIFEVDIQCALCLADVTREFVLPLQWTMLPVKALQPRRLDRDEEIELSAEDLDVSFYRGDELNLTDLVREILILEMEASPRCELDTCETETYGAAPDETSVSEARIDPRWAALAALKGKLSN